MAIRGPFFFITEVANVFLDYLLSNKRWLHHLKCTQNEIRMLKLVVLQIDNSKMALTCNVQ